MDIYDTDHPTQGKLTLYVNWTNRTADVPVPVNYTAESAGAKVTLSGSTVEYPNLLDPGIYTLNLYSTADKITLNGTVVSVATEGNIDINSSVPRSATESRNIAALPGYQFFGTVTTEIEKDKDHTATVVMQQIIRDLHFDLTIAEGDPERIKYVIATLGGIAGAWNCVTNTPQGGAVTVMPLFTRTAKKLTAWVRLLGTTGTSQTLTLNIVFNDGRSQQIVSDITSQLAAFNTNKQQPMTLSGNVNTPIGSTLTGTITDWTVVNGGSIIAN